MTSLRDFLQSIDATQILLTLLGSAGAVFLWMKRRYISFSRWRKMRAARRLAFNELPERVSGFAKLLDGVREQSDRALSVLDEQTKILDDQNRVLGSISAMVHGGMELDPTPRFIRDNNGRNLNVNTAYARLLGCGRDELMGFGYQRFIPAELNPTHIDEFESAVEQHRSVEGVVKIRRSNGTIITTNVRIVPHPEDKPPAHYWIGIITATHQDPDD